MEKVTGIGGVFFRAKDPESLTRWYEDHLGIDISRNVWEQAAGPTVFAPFPLKTEYFGRVEQAWMINLRVSDLEAMIRQLNACGIEVIQNPDWNSEAGCFARIHDPEGNPIELWEPPKT